MLGGERRTGPLAAQRSGVVAHEQFADDTERPPHDGVTDQELATRGDAASFLALYRRYVQPMYRYAYARLRHPHDAEDVKAQVWETAWRSLPHYRPTGSFAGWLFTIAQRTLADHFRRRMQTTVPVHLYAETLPDPTDGPEDVALASDKLRTLLVQLASLSAEQQAVLALRFFGELRYAEIAQALGKRESG